MSRDIDRRFAGSIPAMYDTWLVPLIFEPYATDMAHRVQARGPSRVLELAAGTGVVTRALASALPPGTAIVATDLNHAMLERAAAVGTARPVEWRQADALALPFPDASFDAVVCQFGVMFFPDRPRAFAEARRVLRPGGTLLFSTWDRIEDNDFAHEVTLALEVMFPADPPRFLARTPHGYHDEGEIRAALRAAGFDGIVIETVERRSVAPSARDVALAFCQGTPLRSEIEARDPGRLEEATDAAAAAVAERFGGRALEGRMRAIVVTAKRLS